jgi:hypothetical protein
MNVRSRGQVSVELLVIFAVALLVLIAFIFLSQSGVQDVNRTREQTSAKNVLDDLSGAAKEVYGQGEGAKKLVYVNIPSDVDPLNTWIGNRSIKLRVAQTDYVRTEPFEVHGMLPTSPGGHQVWVISEGNKVRIGPAMIELDKQTLIVTMKPNDTASEDFTVTNIWNRPINVTLSYTWTPTDATFNLSSSFINNLAVNSSQTFIANFSTNNKAVGIYVIDITLIPTDGAGATEIVKLPLILQVTANPFKRPPLIIIPPIFNASLNATQSVTKTFQVCTNEYTSVTGVTFTPSPGSPGSWMNGTNPLGPIGPDSCLPKLLTISVPNGTSLGNYTGYVNLIGQGAVGATDSLGEQVKVGGIADIQCPLVQNISMVPPRVHVFEQTAIFVTANDTANISSIIKGCTISSDNGTTWNSMDAVDGAYDNVTENASFIFYDGFDMGVHPFIIRCSDYFDNVCPQNYSFKIAKHILFVISSGNSTDWSDWITAHFSSSGYQWDYDVATIDQVTTGIVDMTYYDIVIFIDWSSDSTFVNLVLDYQTRGGYVGLFGDSAHHAVRDLGIAWHPDNSHPENQINIVDNTHYVTAGFPLGLMSIGNVRAKTYEIFWNSTATKLGTSGWFYPSTDRTMLADANRTILWGVEDPWRMNQNGVTIATRVIDWMINQSIVR